jgi:hypothetical protein
LMLSILDENVIDRASPITKLVWIVEIIFLYTFYGFENPWFLSRP